MKTLSKIKLNQFSKDELDQRKMNALKGGCKCFKTCSEMCEVMCGWYGESSDVSKASYDFSMATDEAFY